MAGSGVWRYSDANKGKKIPITGFDDIVVSLHVPATGKGVNDLFVSRT